jgi:hypothetical protein
MARHNLFIDTDRSEVVIGAGDSSIAALPAFVQQDTLNLRIILLTGFSRISNYTRIPVAGITLEVALGEKIGDDSLYYTQQFTWTPSSDLANPYFEATLPMNTPAIATLLGSGEQAQAWLEVKMIDGGLPRTVLSKRATIQAAVIKDGGLQEPATPTPLSAETAAATYLQRIIPCSSSNPVILRNTISGKDMAVWLDETDDTFKTVLLT